MNILRELPVVVLVALMACLTTAAFQPTGSIKHGSLTTVTRSLQLAVNRREVVETCSVSSMATLIVASTSFLAVSPGQVLASGGATAGGAYLLSAKQRYNTRVTKGVSNFVELKDALEKGDIETVRTFFSSEADGSWKDFTAAGYLLANAFRTNSSAAPDSLPSVKKWKVFTGQVEAMTKALKKKDIPTALISHRDAIAALDEYLAKVDLSMQ